MGRWNQWGVVAAGGCMKQWSQTGQRSYLAPLPGHCCCWGKRGEGLGICSWLRCPSTSQLGQSVFKQGFDGLTGWCCLPRRGGVSWEEEQVEMVWLSEVGEGGRSVSMLDAHVEMVECIFAPYFTINILVEIRENRLEQTCCCVRARHTTFKRVLNV